MGRVEKKKKKISIIKVIIAIIFLVGIIFAAFKVAPTVTHYTFNDKVTKKKVENDSEQLPKYASETNYIGNDLIPDLYEIPFKKTNAYVMNKYLNLSDTSAKRYIDFTKNVILSQYNIGYHGIMTDTYKFEKGFTESSYFPTVTIGGEDQLLEDYLRELENWVIDTHTTLETTFETNKSLIYEDKSIFVRGQLNVTVRETDDESRVAEYLELDNVKKGQEYKIPVEVEIVNAGDGLKYCSVTFLKNVKNANN